MNDTPAQGKLLIDLPVNNNVSNHSCATGDVYSNISPESVLCKLNTPDELSPSLSSTSLLSVDDDDDFTEQSDQIADNSRRQVNDSSVCGEEALNSQSHHNHSLSKPARHNGRTCGSSHSEPDSPTPPSSSFSSLSNSSSSNSPSGGTSNASQAYSELLRFRSQEFYVKLNPGPQSKHHLQATLPSPDTPTQSTSAASTGSNCLSHQRLPAKRYPKPSSKLCGRELSLNDLSQIDSQLYVNCRLSDGASSSSTPQSGVHSSGERYFPQHPHYRNHLYNSGAGRLSLVRSNSSLSLSYQQQQQQQQQHLNRGFHRLGNSQQQAFAGFGGASKLEQTRTGNLFSEHPRRHLFGPSLFPSNRASPSLTLSTHNLFLTDSGYSSAYSGTLDSRVSRVSNDSSGSNSNARHAPTVNCRNITLNSDTASEHAQALSRSPSNIVIKNGANRTNKQINSSNTTNNHYNTYNIDTAMNSIASGASGPSQTVNTKCPPGSTPTASPHRPGYSAPPHPTRSPLTRSSSSGEPDASINVQPSNGSYYCQSPGYGTVVKGGNLRPAASLVTVLAADGNQIQAYYQPPANVQPLSQYAQPIYGTTGTGAAIYGKLGSANSGVNYGIPQRFPTNNLVAGSKLGGSPMKLAPKTVGNVSSCAPTSAVNSASSNAPITNNFHLSSPGREVRARAETLQRAQAVFGGATGGASAGVNNALSVIGGGMVLDKKNKLFGSVSSIDLQCLKESQKVSVIERKTSRAGRLSKNATVTSATSSGMIAAAAANPDSCSASGGSNGSNNGGAANSFFRLFTSGSSKNNKMIPFAFSNNSANSVSSNDSSASNNTLTGMNATAGDSQRNVKSASIDLPVSCGPSSVSAAPETLMPANEVLFRKYFTFYDLMSGTNLRRLFDCGSASVPPPDSVPSEDTTNRCQKSQTFESNTISSTSSYSSCSSSISSVSQHKTALNGRLKSNAASLSSIESREFGNDLLAPSQNYLNEIGIEKQYSIELRWNNGSKEEIPASMLHQQEHNDDESIYADSNAVNSQAPRDMNHLHPPTLSKRVNIFSDASPFAAYSQHSVMSDLYGCSADPQTGQNKKPAPLATDFSDLDDGFESLSSNSTYPNNLPNSTLETSKCSFSGEASNLLEMDHGSNYYRTHFRDFEHQNWLQIHEKYGPIVVSLRKERLKSSSTSSSSSSQNSSTRWRVIVRTTSLIPLRGTISALPNICNINSGCATSASLDSKSKSSGDNFNLNSVKDVLSLVMPKNVNLNNFRLSASTAVSHLLKLDELSQNTEYKIGVLYAHGNQHSEEEFYNNILEYSNSSKSQFYDFLNLVSSRVRLKNFKGYKAGLDVHKDTTGEYSWTSRFSHVDIMFHVCTELPFTETNRQQLSRKRHIGNDIVTIIFLDEDFVGEPFTPSLIRSKFQQVFIIVKPVNGGQYYRVAVARHKLVPLFGPPLKAYYSRSEIKDLILTKIINAENACHSVNKFAEMAKRTRNEYLVDLCNKHSTNQTTSHFDSSSSSMNSLNSIKKLFGSSSNGSSSGSIDASKKSKLGSNHELSLAAGESSMGSTRHAQTGLVPPFSRSHILNGVKDPPTLLGGCLFTERCAGSSIPSRLYVHDFSTSRDIEASLLISNEAIMVIDSNNAQVIWAAPVTSIIGWTDSSGVFSNSPATLPEKFSQINGHTSSRLTGMRAKSMDAESPASSSNALLGSNNVACRELRLYYHQGECIQIMQRPLLNVPATEQAHAPIISGKSKQTGAVSAGRNDDPFLQLIRLLELVTRRSELREIVIKRKTSPMHKPTFGNAGSLPNKALTFDAPGRCGGQFGYMMDMSTGIIEDVFDQTLTGFQLSAGCKVLEVAKISFSVMSPDELQDLLNASVIISLTFTEFDFLRYQPRCNCAWPQALQLQQKQKNQMTPPSEYENISNTVKKASGQQNYPGVKSIHITHAQSQDDGTNRGPGPSKHHALVSMSSTSSTSSYYSTAAGSSNPTTPPHSNYHQLYNAKSTSNLAQFSVGASHMNRQSESPSKASTNNSTGSPSHGTLSRAKSTTISTSSATSSNFKDNLIRLITMDDCVPSSNPSSPSINGDSSSCFEQFAIPEPKNKPNNASSGYPSNNCSLQQQATTNCLRTNQGKPYAADCEQTNAYSSYPSSRYSTASSAQYSSLGRNETPNYSMLSSGSTQIQLNSAAHNNSGIRPAQSSGNILNTAQKEQTENCYVLTAQPIRVDSANLALQQQQQQNLMTTSLDSSMLNSIMSGTSGSTSETIGDIVWPSMASDTPPSSLMSSSAIRSALANNEIIVTGTELSETPAGQAAQHLTEEVRKLSLEKDVLTDTIYKLREENQRLQMESQNTSHQLRKLTEWFFNSGNSSPVSNSSSTANSTSQSAYSGSVGPGPSATNQNSTTISIQSGNSNGASASNPTQHKA